MKQLPVLLALILALPALAQTYRWVDENGQVHYSQLPPKSGNYRAVAPPPPPAAAPNQDSINESLRNSIESAPAEQSKAAKLAADRADRDVRCRQARDGLAHIDNMPGQRLLQTDDQGNVSRASESEIGQRRAELERSAQAHCG